MVATHIEKVKYSVLCVTSVHLRDLPNSVFCKVPFKCESSERLLSLFQIDSSSKYTVILSREMGDTECEELGCHHARFGMSLTKLGDVNNDGYQGQYQSHLSSGELHKSLL